MNSFGKYWTTLFHIGLENYVPASPTTNASQWQHGTLSRDEAARILRVFVRENLDNKVFCLDGKYDSSILKQTQLVS